jgi:5-methylcytosine-specific restriction endonuclease McrA
VTARPSLSWKKKAFARIAARDGHTCAQCGTPARTIWREMGTWSGDQWGDEPGQSWRYTWVHPTSNLELDHRFRLRDGGTNDDDNLWLLCRDCHKAKTRAEHSSHLRALFAAARSS